MKNGLFNSESNLSRLGKYYMKKNIYLLNRKNYISNLKKIISSKHLKEENTFDYINNFTSNYEKKSIFDIDYENNHDKIIEKQLKKYLDHKDNYKFHSIQAQIINKRQKQKNPIEEQKLLLLPTDNSFNEKSKKNKNGNSFDKISGRYSNTKTIQNDKKDSENKICSRILKAKKIEAMKLKNNFFQINEKKQEKLDSKKLIKKKLSHIDSLDNSSEKNTFPLIRNNTTLSTIQIKNNKNQNKSTINSDNKNFNSLDNSKHIKSGVDFKRMLSRTKKLKLNSNEIIGAHSPLTPRYDLVHPKIIRDFMYKEPTSRKKDFSPKFRKIKFEFFFDLDKVYSKYNNHKEAPSFSLEKISGRKPFYENKKEVYKNGKEKSGIINNKNELNEKINDIMKLKIDKLIDSETLQQDKNTNNIILENTFQEIMKKVLLNKDKKNNDDKRLYKAIVGNKINSKYMKLLKIFSEYKFLNDINKKGNNKIKKL